MISSRVRSPSLKHVFVILPVRLIHNCFCRSTSVLCMCTLPFVCHFTSRFVSFYFANLLVPYYVSLNRSLVVAGEEFQHILRVMNTNLDGRKNTMYALTNITGKLFVSWLQILFNAHFNFARHFKIPALTIWFWAQYKLRRVAFKL